MGKARILLANQEILSSKISDAGPVLLLELFDIIKEYLQPLYIINKCWKIINIHSLKITESAYVKITLSSDTSKNLPFMAIRAFKTNCDQLQASDYNKIFF